jgi:hypothetical protein
MPEFLTSLWEHFSNGHELLEVVIFVMIGVVLSVYIWARQQVATKKLEIQREQNLLQIAIEKERNHAIIEHMKTARSLNRRATDSDFGGQIDRRSQSTRASDRTKSDNESFDAGI